MHRARTNAYSRADCDLGLEKQTLPGWSCSWPSPRLRPDVNDGALRARLTCPHDRGVCGGAESQDDVF